MASTIEEWKVCRNEIQLFNSYLLKARIFAIVLFMTFIKVSMFAYELGYAAAGLAVSIVTLSVMIILWTFDTRYSRLMVAIARRSRALEKSSGMKLSSGVHDVWCSLSPLDSR